MLAIFTLTSSPTVAANGRLPLQLLSRVCFLLERTTGAPDSSTGFPTPPPTPTGLSDLELPSLEWDEVPHSKSTTGDDRDSSSSTVCL
ncbi:hypothetical protein HAX54_002178, partial [Datura stramonium]|nr:hypothetical protein [Datura stramonium]